MFFLSFHTILIENFLRNGFFSLIIYLHSLSKHLRFLEGGRRVVDASSFIIFLSFLVWNECFYFGTVGVTFLQGSVTSASLRSTHTHTLVHSYVINACQAGASIPTKRRAEKTSRLAGNEVRKLPQHLSGSLGKTPSLEAPWMTSPAAICVVSSPCNKGEHFTKP